MNESFVCPCLMLKVIQSIMGHADITTTMDISTEDQL